MKSPTILLLTLILSLFFFSCESNSKVQASETKTSEPKEKSPDTRTTEPTKSPSLAPFSYGIDISQYQGDQIEFLNKTKDSLSFVICKATEGITYIDPRFAQNWDLIKQKGFIRGSYHFYRSNDDPQSQAANYTRVISDLQKTDLPPMNQQINYYFTSAIISQSVF